MKKILYLLLMAVSGCRPSPEYVPIPTQICLFTTHHGQPIPDAIIYLKYNADTFPGYKNPPAYFDDSFRTGKNARGCIQSVPEGRHWMIGFGYDSLHYPNEVFGSLPITISLDGKPKLDTMFYLSEKH
ncbi:MAG: hypothetical protein KGS48_07435 [Bacteroidetes bacterium]|nr:hypothetical protein [Bacteroidota bacterium]